MQSPKGEIKVPVQVPLGKVCTLSIASVEMQLVSANATRLSFNACLKGVSAP